MPCCTTNTTVSNFFTTLNRNSVPTNSPVPPLPPALVTSNLLSVSMSLPIPDVSYEENHTIFVPCVYLFHLVQCFQALFMYQDFVSFRGRTLLRCTRTLQFGYLLLCVQTLGVFPPFDYCQ